MQWIKSLMHEATRTPEEVARFSGPNGGYVLRAIKSYAIYKEALEIILNSDGDKEDMRAMAEAALEKAKGNPAFGGGK